MKMKSRKKKHTSFNKSLLRKKFLNVYEVAELLGVTKRSVWRFKAAGQIPQPVTMRSATDGQLRTLWKSTDLKRWIAKGCPATLAAKSKQKSDIDSKMISRKLLGRKKFLNVGEMMKFLGVSRRSLWRFRRAKQIPEPHIIWDKSTGFKVAVWNADELRRWIAKGCPSDDTIKFAHEHPLHAAMLSFKHSQKRILKMKRRVTKGKRK